MHPRVPTALAPVLRAVRPRPVCELRAFVAFWKVLTQAEQVLWGGVSGPFEVLGKRCLIGAVCCHLQGRPLQLCPFY